MGSVQFYFKYKCHGGAHFQILDSRNSTELKEYRYLIFTVDFHHKFGKVCGVRGCLRVVEPCSGAVHGV